MSDPTLYIIFSSIFPKKAWAILWKLTWIWSGWPGQDLAKLIWSESKLVCRNHRARLLAGHNQPATGFLFSDSFAFFHRCPGCYYKTRLDPIEFWLIVPGFGQTDPVRKQANAQESSGLLLVRVSQLIRPGCESDLACLLGNDDDDDADDHFHTTPFSALSGRLTVLLWHVILNEPDSKSKL